MTNIVLLCQSGMSSSWVVKKIEQAFHDHGEEINIHAYPAIELVDHIAESDVVLVAPNVLYMIDSVERTCKENGVKAIVIPFEYYGQMDGEAIRKLVVRS